MGRKEPMKEMHCPICDCAMAGNRVEWPDYPFCSKRCRQIDLGRWLGEAYRIPKSTPEEEADPDSDPSSS